MNTKGFAAIMLVGVVAIIAIILFSPIPTYNTGRANCLPVDKCPNAGFYLGPSFFQKMTQQSKFSADDFDKANKKLDSENPNTTADWKTYRNEEYRFSFKYPPNYVFVNESLDQADNLKARFEHLNYNTNPEAFGSESYEPRYLEVVLVQSDQTLADYVSSTWKLNEFETGSFEFGELGKGNLEAIDEISTDTINGNSIITIHLKGAAAGSWYNYVKVGDFTIALLTHGYSNSVFDTKLINQILSTFEFIDIPSITQEQASQLVGDLPAVKDYIKRMPANSVHVTVEDRDEYFLIQVFEVKDGHTNTFNWYEVDKATGEITPTF